MNASEQKVLADVEKFGWHVILVPDDASGPGFAFTIGLFRTYRHPEVIVFGLPQALAHQLLNVIGNDVKSGTRVGAGDRSDKYLENASCAFLDFPLRGYEQFLGYARWFYEGDEFPALQCVWPDVAGHFPWEDAAADATRTRQPILGAVV
jgi:hypothetical protein